MPLKIIPRNFIFFIDIFHVSCLWSKVNWSVLLHTYILVRSIAGGVQFVVLIFSFVIIEEVASMKLSKIYSMVLIFVLSIGIFSCSNVNTIDPPGTPDLTPPPNAVSSQFIIYSINPDPEKGLTKRLNIPAIMWVRPADEDCAGIRVVRKAGAEPKGPDDGTVVYEGEASSFVDRTATQVSGEIFVYKIFTYDKARNYSSGVVVNQGVVLYLSTSVMEAMMQRDGFRATRSTVQSPQNSRVSISPADPRYYWGEDVINDAVDYCKRKTEQLVNNTVSAIGNVMDVSVEVAKNLYNEAKELQDDICSNVDCRQVGITLFNYGSYALCAALGLPASPYITSEGHIGVCVGMPGGNAVIFDLQDGSIEANIDGVWVKLEDGELDWGIGVDFGVAGISFDTDSGTVTITSIGNGFQINCKNENGRELITDYILNNGTEQIFTETRVNIEGVAVNNVNVSDYVSNSNSATAEVVDFSVVPNDNQEVVLQWKNPSSRFEKSVLVRKTGGFPENASDGTVLREGTAEGYVDRNVNAGSVYYYKIFTWNGSQYSKGRGVSAAVRADIVPPVVGMDLTAEIHDRKLMLAWQNPADPDFEGVRLVRKADGYPTGPDDGDIVYEGTAESFADQPLVNGSTYYYAAYFYDDMRNYSIGIYVDATPIDIVAPGDAVNFTARATHDRIFLSWSNASDADLAGIRIVRKTGSFPQSIDDGDVIYDGAPKTTHVDTAVSFGQTYYYRIFSYDDDGNWSIGGAQQSALVDYVRFMKTFGGSGTEEGWSVAKTDDGGYVVLGETNSYGAGGRDIWLVKVDCFGNMQWSRTYGGNSEEDAYRSSVQQTSDGGFIILAATHSFSGQYYSYDYDLWIIKTDSNGNIQWNRVIGTRSHDYAGMIKQTSDGGYIVIGTYGNGEPWSLMWLIKLNSNGNTQWAQTYDWYPVSDWGWDVLINSDNTYYLIGTTASWEETTLCLYKVGSNGNLLWRKSLGACGSEYVYSADHTSDGGLIITGQYNYPGDLPADLWLVKTDSVGNVQWDKKFGNPNKHENSYSVKSTADGGYIFTGNYRDDNNLNYIYIVKTNSMGNMVWQRLIPNGYGAWVLNADDGGYVVAGDVGSDIILIKTDPNSNTE